MNGVFGNLFHTWKEIWKMLGVAQRASIVLIGVGTLAAIGAVLYWGSQPDWMVVYADLEPKTAAQLYELAKDDNIPVQLKSGGRTVLVPSRFVNELRMKAERAELGIGQQGSGWELMDDVKLGLTEKQQQVGYQRAVQGELERMLMEMPGIVRARVMLAMPTKRPILRQDVQTVTASVMLTLEEGYYFRPAEVKSVRFLISGAVPGLAPGEVTITDSRGRLLAGRDSAAGLGANSQIETQALLEGQLRDKAEAILGPIAGPENVVATVTVELDVDQVDSLSEKYDAEGAVVVSEKTVSEEMEKQDSAQATAAGASGNVVSVSDPTGATGGAPKTSQQARKTVENQYLVPKVTEKIQRQGIRIKQLSVAVTIGRAAEATARTPEELQVLRKLVASAVGAIDDPASGRQDQVEIVEQAMPAAATDTAAAPAVSWNRRIEQAVGMMSTLRPLLGVLVLGVVFMVFRRVLGHAHGDEVMVGSEQLASGNVLELGKERGRSRPGVEPPETPFDLILERSTESPDQVGDAVEAMLRAESD